MSISTYHATIEEGQAGGHDEHQRRGREHPGNVALVEGQVLGVGVERSHRRRLAHVGRPCQEVIHSGNVHENCRQHINGQVPARTRSGQDTACSVSRQYGQNQRQPFPSFIGGRHRLAGWRQAKPSPL